MARRVIAVDTNILVYAHRTDVQDHDKANACISQLVESNTRWAIPWPCVHEFIGVVTNKRIYKLPTPTELALDQISIWSVSMGFQFLGENRDHLTLLQELQSQSGISGSQIHDARIAAICLSHGVRELWSADRDFSRYPKLKLRNPLVG